MIFRKLELSGLVEVTPKAHHDDRGYFAEIFRMDQFREHVGDHELVQGNQSLSFREGTIRGIHFQIPPKAQGKLVSCIAGQLFDVAVDLRGGSPTYGQWASVVLSSATNNQLWIPAGFGHGFCTLEPNTVISYSVTDYYSPEHDLGLAWDDDDLAISWPDLADPDTLSAKDRQQPKLSELPVHFPAAA